MNNDQWQKHLRVLTGGINLKEIEHIPQHDNHVGLTLKFYLSLGLDSPEIRFLDVGACNDSIKQNIKAQWKGCDINEKIKYNIEYQDAHELKYSDESFDVVYCNHTLEHVISPIIVISELKRICVKKGHIIIGLPLPPSFMCPEHIYMMSEICWLHLFRAVGLEIKNLSFDRGCGMFHLRKLNADL